MNVHAIPLNAIAASPPLASGHADDCCAPPIPHGAIVMDQQLEDAAMELEKRTTIRKNNPDAVTDAELAISKRRQVAVENAAANQSHPQAHIMQSCKQFKDFRRRFITLGRSFVRDHQIV
jgi:hypothetical protein